MSFTVEKGNLEEVISRFTFARTNLGEVMRNGITAVAQEGVTQLHMQSPVDMQENNGVIPGEEGHLNESFLFDPVMASPMGATTNIRTEEPIKFQYVTQGTATPIVPVVKKAMWWPDAPHPMYAVHGQEANPFQVPVGDFLKENGTVLFAPFVDAWLVQLGG